ncbi:MAG: acyl carrier protein [Planctomycetes bacterium]|nr:acyl carrier protein [Planctomycetota bacterium]
MTETVPQRIHRVFRDVFANRGRRSPELMAESPLDASLGLESLDFAEVVVRLEMEFGVDPFANGVPAGVRRLGDLYRLYA